MVSRVLGVVLFLVWACAARQADAQSIYVAGALGADISFVSGQDSVGIRGTVGGGESLSGAARLGVELASRFGVELEVSRAAERSDGSQPGISPLLGSLTVFLPEVDFHTRTTTISTTASIRQQVSDNVALAYLGGVVFHRTDRQIEYRGLRGLPAGGSPAGPGAGPGRGSVIPGGLDPILPVGLALPFSQIDSVQYGVGPVVGFEAHIALGDHLQVSPGVRMHGLPASWLVRPSVAAGWKF
jgi:hypothetical protein